MPEAEPELPYEGAKEMLLEDGKVIEGLPLELLQHERMVVNRISLMKSERGKNGMVYTEIGYIESEKGE